MAVVNPLQPVEMAPQISPQILIHASSRDKAMLIDIQELLNKLFARNVNQHRRNHWWKSLHAFRKQLGLLIIELETTKKSARAEKIEQRLRYWDEKCIHQWYLHFTQLVAVGSFCVLGLVLMACTARVCKITGITALYEEIASEDMKGVLTAVDDCQVAAEFGGILDDQEAWDLGEVVARDDE